MLLACARTDEQDDLLEQFQAFEREVNEHLALEEEYLLPAYAMGSPTDAKILRDDHARIRQLMFEIGVEGQLHELRFKAINDLVELLRAHAARENMTLYPWAETHVAGATKQTLRDRIGGSLQAIERVRAHLQSLRRAP